MTNEDVSAAIAFAFKYLKLVVEPGARRPLPPLTGAVDAKGRTVGVVLSGGNIDPGLFVEILGGKG